jgi:inhibitor of cysteine peptidase
MKTRFVIATIALAASLLLSACSGATPATPVITAEPPQEETPATGGPDEPVNSDTQTAPTEPATPAGDVEIGAAVIDDIDIMMLESFPVQINVTLKGNLPDGCTEPGLVIQTFDKAKKTFILKVSTNRPRDMVCTQALVPFERTIRLDGTVGLEKGIYTVDANGAVATFELTADNGPITSP